MAETSWRRSPTTWIGGSGSSSSMVIRRCSAAAADPLHRLGHDQVDVDRFAGRGLLGLDPAQVEQVVDDPADPEGLGMDPRGQPLGDLGVGLDGQGLGQQAEGADRRLQLVADVGHEVAPDLLEAATFGDVLDDGDDPERPAPVVDEPGAHGQGLPGWAVEVEGALGGTLLPGVLEQLGDGLGGQGVAVPVVHQGHGPGVAEGDLTVLVADDDPLGERVQGPSQPDGVGTGLGDGLGGVAGHFLQVAEDRLHPPVVGGLHTQPVGQGGQSLLEAAPARPPAGRVGDDHGDHRHHAQDDVPDHIRLHGPSVTGPGVGGGNPRPWFGNT